MTAESEHTPETWSQLFPDPQRRTLVRSFVDKVSQIPGIERVAAVEITPGFSGPRLFVATKDYGSHGLLDFEAIEAVLNVWKEICPTPESKSLLGSWIPTTEEELEHMQEEADEYTERLGIIRKDIRMETIWKRDRTHPHSHPL